MKKVWKIFMSLMLTIMMTTTAFAEVNVNVKNENGNITVSGTSDHKSQNVMIETWNQDKKYYIDADKTDENGNFKFQFKTASNINYNGRVKVGGESKDFNFSTGAFVGVQEIKLNKTLIKLKEGQAETLAATIIPKNATNKKIVWTSTNSKIASVDDNGKVTAKSKGKVIIQAISVSGRKKASCNVEVIKSDGETDPSKGDEEKQKEEEKKKKKVTVHIRVEGYDHTIVPRTKVKVGLFDLSPYLGPASGSSATKSKGWGIDKFDEPTNAHAIVKVLNDHGVNYDFQDYGWSLYIAMISGDREFDEGPMSGWMYSVNGQLPPIGCNAKPLEDGDEILWFYGAYGFDTAVTKLHTNKTSIKPGEEVSVTLDGFTTSGAGGEDKVSHYDKNSEKISNATILVDGKEFKVDGKVVKTDSDGKATLKFKRAGKYELSAVRYKKSQGNKIDIVRPLPVEIDVEGDAVKDGKENEKQKKEEESQLVKDAKDEINENSVDSNKLQKEIKGDKEEYTASYSVCIGSADKISEIIKKAIPKAKDDKEKEKIKKEVAVVPIKINDKKDNAVLKIKGDTVKALKNKNIGVKVSFSNSGITIPYDVLPNIKADEHIEIRKNILKDAVNKSLCSSISKKNNILSKVYNLSAFKVDKNNKEEKINIDKEYVYVVMKVNPNELKNMSKRSLKINWYDTKNKKWIILDSQYMKDKNVVVGRLK